MKRIKYICFLISVLCSISVSAQSGYGGDFPDNPTDPSFGGKTAICISAEPSVSAGYFSYPDSVKTGRTYTLYAYPRYGYKFIGWKFNGEIISKQEKFEYTIPASGKVELTGVFEYDPTNPGNPHPNNWDAATGEVILDDFTTGNLIGALNSTISAYSIPTDNIKQITVAGKINAYDFCAFTNNGYPNCELIDFSRTTGLDSIPKYAYCKDIRLKSIFIPSSVIRVGDNAFASCTNLDLVYCYATVPPILDNATVFADIKKEAVLFVPLKSQTDYQNSVWATFFTINAIPDDKVASIQINLPEDNGGIYKNMSIEMVNQITGQVMKYVVTDRWQYTFNNLPRKTQWNAYLKNQASYILSEIKDITVPTYEYSAEHGWRVETFSFTDIKPLRNVDLKVIAGDEDVTDNTSIAWSDESTATILSRQAEVTGLIEGLKVKASVTIPQNLGMSYKEPADVRYSVTAEDNQSITLILEPLDNVKISGVIKDANGDAITNAIVTISQTLNNKYSKSFTVMPDKEGKYTCADAFQVPTMITCSSKNYVTQSDTIKTISEESVNFTMQPIDGARISLKLNFKQIDGTTIDFASPEKVSFTVKNGAKAIDFNLQQKENNNYEIVLLEEVAENVKLTLTATSQDSLFKKATATATIVNKAATATFSLLQLPSIKAEFVTTENSSVIGILYDSNGNLVSRKEYDMTTKTVQFDNLWDNAYTLVTMSYSDFYNSVLKLSRLTTLGLKVGTDYVKNTKLVTAGKLYDIKIASVPVFDDTKLYYTDDKTTNFSLNKNEISVGNYLTVSTKVDLKADKKNYITNPYLIIDLPESVDDHEAYFVNGSLLINQKVVTTGYELTGSQLRIDMSQNIGKEIKFCVIPSVGGDYNLSACLEFNYDGEAMTQPVGSAKYTASSMSIEVPSVSCTREIPVSGTSVGYSSVDIYCDGSLIAQTTSLANGVWQTTCTLPVSDNNSILEKGIYAIITTAQGVRTQTDTKICQYNVDAIDVNVVHMYHNNPEMRKVYDMVFNFKNPSRSSQYFTYYIYNKVFSFTCDFMTKAIGGVHPEDLDSVYIGVKTGRGYTDIPASYSQSQGRWIASGNFGDFYVNDLVPRNVRVSYNQLVNGKFYKHYVVYSGCRDANFGIDPSGYVYEGVSSNRVSGATASIYYKEEVEDMYGVKTEKETLWNAEEYEQKNPLFTDADGMYRWDVPDGLWQVRVEKDGYETAKSEWLPVPPPQLDINIPMHQNSAPEVKEVHAYQTGENNDFVDVTFDKYVQPKTVSTESVILKDVNGETETKLEELTFQWLNAEPVTKDSLDTLVSKVRIFSHADLSKCTEVRLVITSGIKSYAGTSFQSYDQKLDVVPRIQTLKVDSICNLQEGGYTKALIISAQPADASKGKKVIVASNSEMFATLSADNSTFALNADAITLDENGEATVYVKSGILGTATISYSIVGEDLSAETTVKILDAAYFQKTEAPTFTTLNPELYSGQTVGLQCTTVGASIYYTTDGKEPAVATANAYDSKHPIQITANNTTIKAMAVGIAGQSETINGTYGLKQGTTSLKLASGWNWISHDLASNTLLLDALKANSNVKRILNQTSELTKDSKYGWVGNVTGLNASDGYKVYTDGGANVTASDNEANYASTIVTLSKGWNWIGYPVNQSQSIKDALMLAMETETFESGDKIIGLSGGYAQYDGTKWDGSIETLESGEGYMFYAASDKYFTYSNSKVSTAKAESLGSADINLCPWTYDAHAFANVMGVTISLGENDISEAESYVGAFCGDQCRGYAKVKDGIYYLSVHGNTNDIITFRVFDSRFRYTSIADQSFSFETNILGTKANPVYLTFDGATSINSINAFFDDSMPAYDLTGRIIRTEKGCKKLQHGIYIRGNKKIAY